MTELQELRELRHELAAMRSFSFGACSPPPKSSLAVVELLADIALSARVLRNRPEGSFDPDKPRLEKRGLGGLRLVHECLTARPTRKRSSLLPTLQALSVIRLVLPVDLQ